MGRRNKPGSNDIRDYRHVDLLFPSDYITAADLQGRDVVVVIDAIEPRHELQRQSGKDYKPVVRLKGKEKAWVLNKTNAKIIAKIYGPEVLVWIGKAITLFPTRVPFGADVVDAIRVRPRAPQIAQGTPTPRSAPQDHRPEADPTGIGYMPPPDEREAGDEAPDGEVEA